MLGAQEALERGRLLRAALAAQRRRVSDAQLRGGGARTWLRNGPQVEQINKYKRLGAVFGRESGFSGAFGRDLGDLGLNLDGRSRLTPVFDGEATRR